MNQDAIKPLSEQWVLNDLIHSYNKHGRIIVAYDFDNTVYTDKPELKEMCCMVCSLLRECSRYREDISMVCFTCRDGEYIHNLVIPFLDKQEIIYDEINEQIKDLPNDTKKNLSNKILYNIFLDDHCGLIFTYNVLVQFLTWLKVKRGEIPDVCGFGSKGLL